MMTPIPPENPLQSLVAELSMSTSMADLRKVGRALAVFSGRHKPFSAKYLNAVANGSLEPGRDLRRAVVAMLAQIDGGSGTVRISAQSFSPDQEGAMLQPGEPRLCVECGRKFIPNVSRRRRCYICSPMAQPKG